MVIKVMGIILKEYVVGESDKYITLFTKELGKIQASAPRAKKFDKGMASGTEMFVYGEFIMTQYKHTYKLIAVESKFTFHRLREDLTTLSYASYIAEFISEVSVEGSGNEHLLSLMLHTLHSLDKMGDKACLRIRRTFEMRALSLLGFRPELDACISCGQKMKEDQNKRYTICPEEGGMVCEACKAEYKTISISYTSWYVLHYILAEPIKTLFHFEIKPYVLKEIGLVCDQLIAYYIEKPFKTLEFIKSLENL
nr:DNA repair protein RecO [uncultured Niameybacter sp.]